MEFQQKFVQLLKDEVPSHISLADQMADILNISKDSAYRRLRNETPLSLDETMVVCNHFDIDPAIIFGRSNDRVSFKYNKLYDERGSFLKYIQEMNQSLKLMNSAGGKVTYAAEDVPLFHHFAFDHLAAFKIFYWSKAVLNSDLYVGQKFSFDLIHPDILDEVKKLHDTYQNAYSTEIWTEESVNSTLRQFEYFTESGQFQSKDDAFKVVEDFREMVKGLQIKAEKSTKLHEEDNAPRNHVMYNSEVLIGNNCILMEFGEQKVVYLSHNTFNSLSTTDEDFVNETEKWMKNLIRKSTLISDVSEKHRFKFFKKVFEGVDQTISRIEKMEL